MIFRRFLLYLYGAPVDKNVGLESICELMLLADRYSVDSLKVSWHQLMIKFSSVARIVQEGWKFYAERGGVKLYEREMEIW